MSNPVIQVYKNKSSTKPPAIHLPIGVQEHELIHSDLIKTASALFLTNGVLTVHQLFPQPFIRQLYDAFCDRYHPYFGQQEYADALDVGDKRRMLTVEFQAPFNHPDLYGNPFLLAVMRSLLGDDVVLGSFGAVIALPGAQHQHIHRDHPPLFNNEAFDLTLPSFAITLVVPLVNLTPETGSTRVWKGSHRQSDSIKADEATSFVPLMPTGSCYLMDYQLLHGGTPNQSNWVRPLLYLIYHRPWFQEAVNYEKQDRLAISPSDYATIPDPYRFLFKQVRPKQTKRKSMPSKGAEVSTEHQTFSSLSVDGQIKRLTKVVRNALKHYGLTNADIDLIHHGENTTFLVQTADRLTSDDDQDGYHPRRFVLRISRAHYLTVEMIESELQWLHELSQNVNFAVPSPVATIAGPFAAWVVAPELLDEQSEGRVCSLMRWINGHPFQIENPFDCEGMTKFETAGRLIGHLHHYAAHWSTPPSFTRPMWNWNGLFGKYAGYSDNGAAVWKLVPAPYRLVFESVSQTTKAVMSALGEDPTQFGLIHGDFWQGNLLWREGEMGLIDFADCGWGYWGFDIARLLSDFSLSKTTTQDLKLFLHRVLKGYKEVRAFPSKQLAHIPLFMAAQQVTFGLWCINRAQDHSVFRSNLDHDLSLIARAIDTLMGLPWSE